MHHALQEVRVGSEIRVEDRDQLAVRSLQADLQGACLVTFPTRPADVLDGDAFRALFAHGVREDSPGLVIGIVQHLNFQQFPGVLEAAHRLEQFLDHEPLVVDRQLDGDAG